MAKREKARRPGVYVSRTVPSNVEIPGEAVDTMDKALAHKYEKLAGYRRQGYRTLILLDGRDMALTNEGDQYKAYLRVCRANLLPDLDEVWLANVFDGPKESYVDYYCFRGDPMPRANPENFMFERKYDDYWYKVIDEEGSR